MTKVKLAKLEKTLYVLAVVFALVSVIMMVGTAIVPTEATGVKQKIDAGFYGYEIVFGIKDGDLSGLKFSFLAFLPYFLALAGIVLLVLRVLDKFLSKKFDFLIAGILLVSSLLFLFSGNFVVYSANLVGELFSAFSYKMSYGLIVSGVCAFVAAGLAIASFVLSEVAIITEETAEKKEETKTEKQEETK